MARPIHLTLAQVKEAGLKAYHEKRLSAQGPTPGCFYRDPSGRPCVIGASLADEDAKRFDAQAVSAVSALCGMYFIKISASELGPIAELQQWHDRWAHGSGLDAESTLLALLEGREP